MDLPVAGGVVVGDAAPTAPLQTAAASSDARKRKLTSTADGEGEGDGDVDGDGDGDGVSGTEEKSVDEMTEASTSISLTPLDGRLLTMSTVPKARWLNLTQLDHIKVPTSGGLENVDTCCLFC